MAYVRDVQGCNGHCNDPDSLGPRTHCNEWKNGELESAPAEHSHREGDPFVIAQLFNGFSQGLPVPVEGANASDLLLVDIYSSIVNCATASRCRRMVLRMVAATPAPAAHTAGSTLASCVPMERVTGAGGGSRAPKKGIARADALWHSSQ